jgi:2-oxoglutarate ferredoxin oxidoreductase subunit beta
VDPCELAISTGATWVARGFSGEMKGLTEMIADGLAHNGFSFLNVMSPCVTWRGDDQFKEMKAKVAELPEDYDPARRASSVPFTREKDKITCGVLYRAEVPSLTDQLEDMKERAMGGNGAPSTKEMLSEFYPKF